MKKKGGIKGDKAGKKKGSKKTQVQNNVACGPIKKPNDSYGPKKGSWTRIPYVPKECMEIKAQGNEVVMKCKIETPDGLKEGRAKFEKK